MKIISDNIAFENGEFICRHCGKSGYKRMAQVRGHMAMCPIKNQLDLKLLNDTDKAFILVGFLNQIMEDHYKFSYIHSDGEITILRDFKFRDEGHADKLEKFRLPEACQMLKRHIERYRQSDEPLLLKEIARRQKIMQAHSFLRKMEAKGAQSKS